MTTQRLPTRQRLIDAALELFASRGVIETTTRQIAEHAGVNEVTLFRQFGNKHGLLLAVIEEANVLTTLAQTLLQQATHVSSLEQALKDYADSRLEALAAMPELVRSLVGEAGQYPTENRQALGREISQANHFVAQYLEAAIHQGQLQTLLPTEKIASLLNSLLLGYAVLELTSEFHQLWNDRQDFLNHLIALFVHGAVTQVAEMPVSMAQPHATLTIVADLPPQTVHTILQRAKKLSLQDYALIYVLFAAGVSSQEAAALERRHHISTTQQHLLQVTQGSVRQVPVNQWIMGKRYGSYINNPLTQWLKSRKDDQPTVFLNDSGQPLSEREILSRWQKCTQGLFTPDGNLLAIEQAQQTWCVEMLVKGMRLEDLSLLTGVDSAKLQPYAQRAKEKLALEQAIRLDHKPSKSSTPPMD